MHLKYEKIFKAYYIYWQVLKQVGEVNKTQMRQIRRNSSFIFSRLIINWIVNTMNELFLKISWAIWSFLYNLFKFL